jgi:hypothetical protein
MSEIAQQSYSGRLFRPAPETLVTEGANLGIVATPWGPRTAAKRVVELVRDYVESARQDMEATSPFQFLTCVSPLANTLRVSVMMANDSIYREENKLDYQAGVELFVFSHQKGELAYATVGLPQAFVLRKGAPWIVWRLCPKISSACTRPPT